MMTHEEALAHPAWPEYKQACADEYFKRVGKPDGSWAEGWTRAQCDEYAECMIDVFIDALDTDPDPQNLTPVDDVSEEMSCWGE